MMNVTSERMVAGVNDFNTQHHFTGMSGKLLKAW